ncbi:MAG: radical SAM protein [Candidatus Aminicenantes bacterium]|nr:radical SAM protein [Candidatus Aminicenantes bacterium]
MVSSARKLELVGKALDRLSPLETACTLCPRDCRTDRTKGSGGICHTGSLAAVSHALLHFGEEPVISGAAGSGTIFFTGCNLKCLFCQNYQLSWQLEGHTVTDRELATMMLGLREKGAHNINFVSPSHIVLPILRALRIALAEGLDIPLVWNSNGYDSVEVVRELEGIIDVYLPDLKYRSPELSKRHSAAPDYFDKASEAVREMSLQQPALDLGPGGTARKGLVVRHLILPGAVEDTLELLDWIGENLSPFIGLSLMSQYHPCFKAPAEIQRSVSPEEYRRAAGKAAALGLDRLVLQPEPFGADEHLVPDFKKDSPFRWK